MQTFGGALAASADTGGWDRRRRAFVEDCVRWIEAEHRRWAGTDERDPLLIHIAELDLTDHHRPGPAAVVDLREFTQGWIAETLRHWLPVPKYAVLLAN